MGCSAMSIGPHVTFVVPKLPPGQGGMERQAYLQAKYLSRKVALSIYSISVDSQLFSGENINFINHRPYSGPLAKEINAFRLFWSMLWRGVFFRPGVLYIHQINLLTFFSLLVCLLAKKKTFVKIANSGPKFDLRTFLARFPYLRPLKFIFAQKSTHYLCLNKQNIADFNSIDLPRVNFISFRNGVEFELLREKTPVTGCIQYVGRLEPVKGVRYIFKLAGLMLDTKFSIIGGGSCYQKYKELASEYSNVALTGEKLSSEIPWNESEWLILPSSAEGMSNVLLEALARGKGIICRPIRANMFLKKICNKVVWINEDPQKTSLEILSLTGKQQTVKDSFKKYSIESVVDDLFKILLGKI